MLEQSIEIINKLGLHARAATKLAKLANSFSSDIGIHFNGKKTDGKSIMSLMLLAASKGSQLTITTEGKDEAAAMEAIVNLINNKFGEEE